MCRAISGSIGGRNHFKRMLGDRYPSLSSFGMTQTSMRWPSAESERPEVESVVHEVEVEPIVYEAEVEPVVDQGEGEPVVDQDELEPVDEADGVETRLPVGLGPRVRKSGLCTNDSVHIPMIDDTAPEEGQG